ncbi:MAG: hypothetical protein H6709_09165 [Kofleriaceae bacterium]|nr:hypothetical protein [Kofleriaceae bacterium]MCB9572240.1 hypothetical protein [Kofleriaceae bacterium]
MIAFEELSAALDRWRTRNGLPLATVEVPASAAREMAPLPVAAAAATMPRPGTDGDVVSLGDADVVDDADLYADEGDDFAMSFAGNPVGAVAGQIGGSAPDAYGDAGVAAPDEATSIGAMPAPYAAAPDGYAAPDPYAAAPDPYAAAPDGHAAPDPYGAAPDPYAAAPEAEAAYPAEGQPGWVDPAYGEPGDPEPVAGYADAVAAADPDDDYANMPPTPPPPAPPGYDTLDGGDDVIEELPAPEDATVVGDDDRR